MRKTKNISIQDIADICKVGVATVSRVVNGKKGVNPSLRAKILQTIRDMGFQSNTLSSRLKPATEKKLVVLLGSQLMEQEHSVYQAIIREWIDLIPLQEYEVLVLPQNRRDALQKCLTLSPFAVVETSPYAAMNQERESLINSGCRYLSISSWPTTQGISLYFDFYKAGHRAAKLLRLSGHRRIGCFTGLSERGRIDSIYEAVTLPQKAFFEGIASAHKVFSAGQDIFGDCYNDLRSIRAALKEKKHTAWICDDWHPCMQLLRTAWELGLRVPDDLSIVTLAPQYPEYLFPLPMTRIFPNARRAAEKLLELLNADTDQIPEKAIPLEMDLYRGKSIRKQNTITKVLSSAPSNDSNGKLGTEAVS